MPGDPLRFLAVSVGNTRTGFALVECDEPEWSRALPNADREALLSALRGVCAPSGDGHAATVVMASVNDPLADIIGPSLRSAGAEVRRIGRDIPIPIAANVDSPARTGQDRLLAALAAYDLLEQACVVVDAGTALTIDFVDGEGAFQGGAILPGARMGLSALHERTSALPDITLDHPSDAAPFGKTTRDAMLQGAVYGARGAVRLLTERYAERFGAYPLVIATGGDAPLLFEGDELIDRIIPDLVLRGVAIAARAGLRAGSPDQP